MRGAEQNPVEGRLLRKKVAVENENSRAKRQSRRKSKGTNSQKKSGSFEKQQLSPYATEERKRLLGHLPLDVDDPLHPERKNDFSYLLSDSSVSDVVVYPLWGDLEFLLWHDEDDIDIDRISGYRGILYNKRSPLALLAYDETEEAFILYGKDDVGQPNPLLRISTRRGGLLIPGRRKKSYESNPQRAIAQDINDALREAASELSWEREFDPIAAVFGDSR